jgi:hypothetical protein
MNPRTVSLKAEAAKRQEASRAKPGERVGQVAQKVAGPKAGTGDARSIAAAAVGANHTYVSDAKRLTKEAPDVAEAAKAGKLSMADAKAVVKFASEVRQEIRICHVVKIDCLLSD